MRYDQDMVRKILAECEQSGATDIHFKVPGRPMFRTEGRLVAAPFPELGPDDTRRVAQELLAMGRHEIPLNTLTEHTFSFGVQKVGRFRAYLYRQRGSLALVVHRMACFPPKLADIGGSEELGRTVWEQSGLVLVSGGDERMAVLAALAQHFNSRRTGYLLVVDHPMEYLHADGSAVVAQREVPHDSPTVADALRYAMTGDCDGVVVSDLDSPEAAEMALQCAEKGIRVIASMLGCPWREAPRWFVRRFPQWREREVTERLRRVLRYVVYDDNGRLVAARADKRPSTLASENSVPG